jgi:hypothetical protein
MVSYEQAVKLFGREALGHPKIVVTKNGLIINDGTHGLHDEDNPDDGELSQFAVALAAKLKEFGISSQVRRLG